MTRRSWSPPQSFGDRLCAAAGPAAEPSTTASSTTIPRLVTDRIAVPPPRSYIKTPRVGRRFEVSGDAPGVR